MGPEVPMDSGLPEVYTRYTRTRLACSECMSILVYDVTSSVVAQETFPAGVISLLVLYARVLLGIVVALVSDIVGLPQGRDTT